MSDIYTSMEKWLDLRDDPESYQSSKEYLLTRAYEIFEELMDMDIKEFEV